MAVTLCDIFPQLKDKKPVHGKYWVSIIILLYWHSHAIKLNIFSDSVWVPSFSTTTWNKVRDLYNWPEKKTTNWTNFTTEQGIPGRNRG